MANVGTAQVEQVPGRGDFEKKLMARVSKRCIPVLIIAYIIAYIDRINVGFAAIAASKDLDMSPAVFGFGAGLFFIAYLLFEVPSNYVMEKVGARRWLARIMITCGIVGGSMVFVSGPKSFYTLRFILGAVEAGLFPGVILYLTYWFPKRYRARYVGMFALGIPLAGVVGSPISGMLLSLDGVWGFKGWQWLYVLEAIPAVVLGVLIWMFLTDEPHQAHWLEPTQREWLQRTMERERGATSEKSMGFIESLRLVRDMRVVILAIVLFGTGVPSYGLGLWLPQIVKSFGLTDLQTGFVSAIPSICGCIALIYWARHSDRTQERVWHTVIAASVAAIGMAACFVIQRPILTVAALSVAAIGTFAIKGPFLSAVSESFSKETAAVGIAMVVSIGNLSGFAAPWMIGALRQLTGSFATALLAVGLCSLIGGLFMFLRPTPKAVSQTT